MIHVVGVKVPTRDRAGGAEAVSGRRKGALVRAGAGAGRVERRDRAVTGTKVTMIHVVRVIVGLPRFLRLS